MRSGSVEGVITALSESEAWQGNMTDDERKICLVWAERRLSEVLTREASFIRGTLSTLNMLLRFNPLDRGKIIRAVLGK